MRQAQCMDCHWYGSEAELLDGSGRAAVCCPDCGSQEILFEEEEEEDE